jgi:hypothetical protein
VNLQDPQRLVFFESPTLGIQGKGSSVRRSELPPEEQERLRSAVIYEIKTGTVDDHLADAIRRKMGGRVIKP